MQTVMQSICFYAVHVREGMHVYDWLFLYTQEHSACLKDLLWQKDCYLD